MTEQEQWYSHEKRKTLHKERYFTSTHNYFFDVKEAKQSDSESKQSESELSPAFFQKLASTGNWQEFEEYTYYLLKLLGIQTIYNFLGERQAGKADGFFKLGNLAVLYDCSLDAQNIESSKGEQINNYCNRLKQGTIEVSSSMTEEFYNHHKQVMWQVLPLTLPAC